MDRGDEFVWIRLDGKTITGTVLGQIQKLNGTWWIICEDKEGVIFMTQRGEIRKKVLPPLKKEGLRDVEKLGDRS